MATTTKTLTCIAQNRADARLFREMAQEYRHAILGWGDTLNRLAKHEHAERQVALNCIARAKEFRDACLRAARRLSGKRY